MFASVQLLSKLCLNLSSIVLALYFVYSSLLVRILADHKEMSYFKLYEQQNLDNEILTLSMSSRFGAYVLLRYELVIDH